MRQISSILTLLFCAAPAAAGWQLDADNSRIAFTTIKANTAAEVHTFGKLSGEIDDDGGATLSILLDSVDTAIEIRDERMRELLFETATYPVAAVAVDVDPAQIGAVSTGESVSLTVEASLSLHGTNTPLTAQLSVARLSDDRLLVVTEKPVVVNASQVGLLEGVEKLREVAGLPSISPAVPVTLLLVFERD